MNEKEVPRLSKLKAYVVEVSDEGKQSDNFIGYYTVYAKSKSEAINRVKESNKVPSDVKNSAKIRCIRPREFVKRMTYSGTDIKGNFVVHEVWYDCYN